LLKNSSERQLKPTPLSRSVSCSHVDILKSKSFEALITKVKESMPVTPKVLSDDTDDWDDDVGKEKAKSPTALDVELLQRLERLNRRLIQKHNFKVQFNKK